MLHLTLGKVEIHWLKIHFIDCKWSNLNVLGSSTPWCHSLLVSAIECPFLWMLARLARPAVLASISNG